MNDLVSKEIRFTERFQRLHSLRFHMSLILLVTVCSGLLATRIMLALGLKNLVMRYPLAVLGAYLVFFLLVKLWLKFVVSLPLFNEKSSSGSFNVFPNISGSRSSGCTTSGGGLRGGRR